VCDSWRAHLPQVNAELRLGFRAPSALLPLGSVPGTPPPAPAPTLNGTATSPGLEALARPQSPSMIHTA
jgi:hypothetical protein